MKERYQSKITVFLVLTRKRFAISFCYTSLSREVYEYIFSTRKFEGIPQIIKKEKCDDLRWFALNNLPDNTIERIKQVIKCMENGIIYDDGNFSYLKMKQSKSEKFYR